MDLAQRHLRAGWIALAVYLTLGIALEALHGFKVGLYLDVGNETRRLLFRLAHAHGTLLGIVNILYGLTVRTVPDSGRPLASGSLLAALVLLPLGFFAGGIVIHGGDPGLPILLVPVGAIALLVGTIATARALRS
ncbi:MAG TPA: hypothetical protein VF316_15230 [Polyangiaceae bacterium]